MAKGLGLLVGLKQVDAEQYGGWDGKNGCWGCELDVDNVERILEPLGYETTILKTSEATHDNVLEALRSAARSLEAGDMFVFYYSGHGGQQPDENTEELDGQDETLVAYDRQIIDDELNEVWLSMESGVRIVMISDSCNSGTNYRLVRDFSAPSAFIPVLDEGVQSEMKAQLIHFGGCRDGSPSAGYLGGGAFTMALCDAWEDGAFKGSYRELLEEAASKVSSEQKPQYSEYGPVSDELRNARPFEF